MLRNMVGGLAAAVVIGSGLLMVGVGPMVAAVAASSPPACAATATVTIKPGLTLSSAKQTETLTGSLTGCTNGPVTSGTASGKLTGSQSCTSGTTKGDATIKWNTGKTSKISATLAISSSGSGTLAATVVGGVFKGDPVTVTGSESHNGDCIFSAVTKVTLKGTITF